MVEGFAGPKGGCRVLVLPLVVTDCLQSTTLGLPINWYQLVNWCHVQNCHGDVPHLCIVPPSPIVDLCQFLSAGLIRTTPKIAKM
jgi:hypothetical protein